jgi:nicotinate-nucleotide pyrophosphorylase (carboxylating)
VTLPQRLAATTPGWTTYADVVVIGSGIAGLTAALRLRGAGSVMVVTKESLSAGSTRWAQGGIAAALGPGDTPDQHLHDTLVAGGGICDEAAVRTLVTEGPDAVRGLIALGTQFDHTDAGELLLAREGGHLRDRIAHAGGDATGAEIQRALVAAVRAAPDITVTEHALVLDLIPGVGGGVAGATLHVMGEGQHDGVGAVLCRAVVLASGGLGQVFSATTNPSVSTGDGMALALRAGAVLRDLEFVQFHPTVMWLGAESKGQQPLISEAVRGEGAFLVDGDGTRFMQGQHALADLAPRDVVAKAIMRRMRETGSAHMWLDARAFGEMKWQQRFPTILATCRAHGIDPVTEPIPVAPACHYASGGVATDLDGRTSVPGLFACGEVACSGVHGANRLASNSLLEGLVFSQRIAAALTSELPARQEPAPDPRTPGLVASEMRSLLQQTMTEHAGVLRNETGLALAAAEISGLVDGSRATPATAAWETTNLVTVSAALVAAARMRQETRGSHWREDFPDTDDLRWCGHIDVAHAGALRLGYHPKSSGPPRTPYDHMPSALLDELAAAGLDPQRIYDDVVAAVAEDLPGEDVTSEATIPAEDAAWADLVARADGVVAGLAVAELVFRFVAGDAADVKRQAEDGQSVLRGDVLMSVHGPVKLLLTAERTTLNFLCHLSGVATTTSSWVRALDGTGAKVRDTRKTTPHFRALEKYAVRCGGGVNHRATLSDQALVKDNHVLAAGGVVPAYQAVLSRYPGLPVQVEVTTLDQLAELLEVGADQILLDNMSTALMAEAVRINAGRAKLEASGGLTIARAREVAETGVDFLAVGALTHSAPVLDVAMDLRSGSAGGA